ncbi:hypothetical protein JVX91_17375 [Pseudomonas sp. PDNC002]|uniref:hypothetical protein n=1 Tax=Pseudomonas sp. PDNC002 TaxID=2811422 RepID=UPI0019663075|nr:hypothetical protein [Pseudomonas sp. PDNC002]QRY77379.1 hypothetical protein JVX91_17375 [Pseudomonas sp. PDNC002]
MTEEQKNKTRQRHIKKIRTSIMSLLLIPTLAISTEATKPATTSNIAKKINKIYVPIFGRMDGSSFYVHYCLPEFTPIQLANCAIKIPAGKKNPDLIQVQYFNQGLWKEKKSQNLEGYTNFIFPFELNRSISPNNPYKKLYEETSFAKNRRQTKLLESQSSTTHPDLEWYTEKNVTGGWWVPKNKTELKTFIGNPPIFSCSDSFCNVTIDLENGWIAKAQFDESALNNWRAFFEKFKNSTKTIMGD